ncbi:MAG: hypothetical protein M3186_06950 [Actinomycetota bacterium]|nr:hypothetical protein [Actinomycetota bacterium]
MAVIIGMGPHKRSATIEVIDDRGQVLAAGKYGTDKTGYAEMVKAGWRSHSGCGRSRVVTALADTSRTV